MRSPELLFDIDSLLKTQRLHIRPEFGNEEHIEASRPWTKLHRTPQGNIFTFDVSPLLDKTKIDTYFYKPAIDKLCEELHIYDQQITITLLASITEGQASLDLKNKTYKSNEWIIEMGLQDDYTLQNNLLLTASDWLRMHQFRDDQQIFNAATILTMNHSLFHELGHLSVAIHNPKRLANYDGVEFDVESFAAQRSWAIVHGHTNLAAIWPGENLDLSRASL